jgi:hypothetical protein
MIEVNLEQIDRLERVLMETPEKVPRVASRAINRAATTARTEAARKVRQEYVVKHGDVIKTIKIKKASAGELFAEVTSKGPLLPLIRFKVNPRKPSPRRKAPLRASVKRGGGGPIKRAFTAQMASGHTGVYQRVGDKRFPIRQLHGPAVPQMIDNKEVGEWVEEKASERLEERLDHEINRVLEG